MRKSTTETRPSYHHPGEPGRAAAERERSYRDRLDALEADVGALRSEFAKLKRAVATLDAGPAPCALGADK